MTRPGDDVDADVLDVVDIAADAEDAARDSVPPPPEPKPKRLGRPRKRSHMRVDWHLSEADVSEIKALRRLCLAGDPGIMAPAAGKYAAVVKLTTKLLRSRRPPVKFALLTEIIALLPETTGPRRPLSAPDHPLRTFQLHWSDWFVRLKTPSTAMAVVRRIDTRVAKFAVADLVGVPPGAVRKVQAFWRHLSAAHPNRRKGR